LQSLGAEADSPRFREAAERLRQDAAEALDDDLNAPRAVAAVFAFMNEAHAAMDAGDRPGRAALSAWEDVESVLGVTSRALVLKVPSGDPTEAAPPALADLAESPPEEPSEELQKAWAFQWAVRRKQAKAARNYAEADRIRGFLREAGWEVRDARDGSIEVVRVRRAS
jgi:cysteinyl-tRNA synthetase